MSAPTSRNDAALAAFAGLALFDPTTGAWYTKEVVREVPVRGPSPPSAAQRR